MTRIQLGNHHQKLRERHGTAFPLEPPKGANPDDTLTLEFWPPELWDNKFVVVSHPVGIL